VCATTTDGMRAGRRPDGDCVTCAIEDLVPSRSHRQSGHPPHTGCESPSSYPLPAPSTHRRRIAYPARAPPRRPPSHKLWTQTVSPHLPCVGGEQLLAEPLLTCKCGTHSLWASFPRLCGGEALSIESGREIREPTGLKLYVRYRILDAGKSKSSLAKSTVLLT